jgi:hypothetical protein
MTWLRMQWPLAVVALAFLALAACEEQGPAERVGEAIDDGAAQVGEALEGAAERVQDATN